MEYLNKMVSIVIPVYQAKDYLKTCMESILNQTYRNTEIILVDDGSEDGSSELCDSYSQKYTNVFSIHQRNTGVSSARNEGINNAKGEYILFIDSDDYIETDYLEKALFILESKNVDMYLCGYQNVKNNGKRKEKKYYSMINEGVWIHDDLSSILMKLFRSTTLHAIGTKIYKKDLIEINNIRFQEEWKYYEDIYFSLNYLSYCNKIYVHNKIMYYYRKDCCDSLSKQIRNQKYENMYKTYFLLYTLMNCKKISNEDKGLFLVLYLEQVNLCINSKILTEKYYTVNIHKLYKKLSEDMFYRRTLAYAGILEKAEHLLINQRFYFLAYCMHNLFENFFKR